MRAYSNRSWAETRGGRTLEGRSWQCRNHRRSPKSFALQPDLQRQLVFVQKPCPAQPSVRRWQLPANPAAATGVTADNILETRECAPDNCRQPWRFSVTLSHVCVQRWRFRGTIGNRGVRIPVTLASSQTIEPRAGRGASPSNHRIVARAAACHVPRHPCATSVTASVRRASLRR
jgi:hypothetical protein